MFALESLFAMSEPSSHNLTKVDLNNMIIHDRLWDLRTDSIIISQKSCPQESSSPFPPEDYSRAPASCLVSSETHFLVKNVNFLSNLHSKGKD